MEFGRMDNIGQIDFSLPPDDPLTEELWKGLPARSEGSFNLYSGCTVWGRKEWIGKVYPRGAKDKDFLSYYVKQFNCIELNTLFYSLQPKPVIEKWASLAGPEFRFCPKFSNTISHELQLKNADRETALFTDHMLSFDAKLGPSFLQLSDGFGPDRAKLLQDYVRMLPRDFSTCVELRHKDWFRHAPVSVDGRHADPMDTRRPADSAASIDTWRLFRELGIGTVITDTAGRRDCLHMKLTAPVAFVRFVANNRHPTDHTRIDAWADRIKTWMDRGLKEAYFFIHNKEELNSPELCKYAVERFAQACGLDLKPPVLPDKETPGPLTLFG
jgi:uncharacterized protein YecE (DUF72 family)